MPEAVTIRPATSSDIAAMSTLLQTLFALEEDFSFDGERARRGLELMLSGDGSQVFVAQEDGSIVGMCSGQLTISTAEGGPAALVEDVVVRQERRGRGIGKRLMRAVSRWADEQGAARLQLLADRENSAALDFYGTLGWEPTQLVCLRRRTHEYAAEKPTAKAVQKW